MQEFVESQHRSEYLDVTYYCAGVGKVKTVQKHVKENFSRMVETTRVLVSTGSARD